MKLFFSLIIFLSNIVDAREIIVITAVPQQQAFIENVVTYITKNLGIDKKLITTTQISNHPNSFHFSDAIIQIHINKQQEISFPIYQQEKIRNLFKQIVDIKKPLAEREGQL